MSETTREASGSPKFPACLGLDLQGRPALSALCDHVANWVESFEPTANRVNNAEASRMSEGDIAAANAEEVEALLEIEGLADMITEMHAVNQAEVEAKKRALDALTSIAAWERDSLFALHRSIERDQLEVNALLFAVSPPAPAQRLGWLSRLSIGVAKG